MRTPRFLLAVSTAAALAASALVGGGASAATLSPTPIDASANATPSASSSASESPTAAPKATVPVTLPSVPVKSRPRPIIRPSLPPAPKPPAPKPPVIKDVDKYGLDKRCDDEVKVLCADQSRRKVWYLENGKVVKVLDARFGARSTPTRNGAWRIYYKKKDEISRLYGGVPMPYSAYFSGGEAFHYSADFARVGWNNSRGGSHGCINLRDFSGWAWVWNRIPVGTLAIVTP